jgi:outer membrane scaffolding protein for murein synthesis (MipA/OmpV family)
MSGAARWLAGTAMAAFAAHGEELPLWELGIGAAAISFPDYRGSGVQRAYLLPVPVFIYRGEIFRADRERMRGLLFKNEVAEVDMSVNGSVPVQSGDDTAREGMPNLDPTLEIGPSLDIRLMQEGRHTLRLRLPVRAVIASDFHSVEGAGVLANPNLSLDVRLDQDWKLGFVAGALIGDSRYHGYFYNVAPQYARPGRPAYSAPGGYSGSQLIASLSKRFGAWWAGGFVKHDFLQGAAFEASPLVEQKNNFSAGIALTWIFSRSDKLVTEPD